MISPTLHPALDNSKLCSVNWMVTFLNVCFIIFVTYGTIISMSRNAPVPA